MWSNITILIYDYSKRGFLTIKILNQKVEHDKKIKEQILMAAFDHVTKMKKEKHFFNDLPGTHNN